MAALLEDVFAPCFQSGCVYLDTIIPWGLPAFLAMCGKRPATFEVLCQDQWRWENCEVAPVWFRAIQSRKESGVVENLALS